MGEWIEGGLSESEKAERSKASAAFKAEQDMSVKQRAVKRVLDGQCPHISLPFWTLLFKGAEAAAEEVVSKEMARRRYELDGWSTPDEVAAATFLR